MDNSNDQGEDPKKKDSQKRKKQTLKQAVKGIRSEEKSKKKAASKTKDRLPRYSTNTATGRPIGPAGNLQQTHKKRQKSEGVKVNEKNNLCFARADLLTPTKKVTDVNKIARANFAGRVNKTEKNETKRRASRSNSPRKRGKLENGSPQMDGAPPASILGINTRRLLLEDFIMLQPRTTVTILVSNDHATYQVTFSKLQPTSTIRWDLDDPSTTMHCYEAVVVTNPQLSGLSIGTWTREEIKDLLTYQGGGAVAFVFPNASGGIELKWAEFVEYPKTLHVWAAMPNHRNYHEMLKAKRKNKEVMVQLHNRLCREAYGDKCALALIHQAYSTILASESKSKSKQEEDPTRKKSCQVCGSMTAITVPNPNALPATITQLCETCALIEFYKFMDDLVMQRIYGCYGQFCNLHSRVLSRDDMKRLIQTLQQTCPEEVSLTKKVLHIDERIAKNDSIGSIHLIPQYEKMMFWTCYENTR
jgi:hypothetical protein